MPARSASPPSAPSVLSVALTTPVLIAVDDLQWLDRATARILAFVVRRAAGEPLALLASVRGARDGDLPAALERAVERLQRVDLGPLSLAGIHHLLRERLGLEPPRPLLVRLHETSRGNPFVALELGAALERFGRAPAAGEPLPVSDDLRELLRQRFADLSPKAPCRSLWARVIPPALDQKTPGARLELEVGPPRAQSGVVLAVGDVVSPRRAVAVRNGDVKSP
jgi:hypothetical protein